MVFASNLTVLLEAFFTFRKSSNSKKSPQRRKRRNKAKRRMNRKLLHTNFKSNAFLLSKRRKESDCSKSSIQLNANIVKRINTKPMISRAFSSINSYSKVDICKVINGCLTKTKRIHALED